MDENAMRSLLEQAAGAAAPPSLVDIARARRIGRRHLRLRRFGAPAASVSAVAVVVGLVASGTLPIIGGRPEPGASGAVAHRPAFNPLVPYATFGWLPKGYSVSAPPYDYSSVTGRTVEELDAFNGPRKLISLLVFAPRQCRLTGMRAGRGPRRSTFTCDGRYAPFGLGPEPLIGPVPGVLGGHAYWWAGTARKYHGLVFRTIKAWVDIEPGAIAPATVIKIAAHVRLGSGRPLIFPFRLSGLPSWWRVGSSTPWTLGGRLVGRGLSIGPAPHYYQVQVYVAPANMPLFCGKDSGWQWVTVAGRRGILRTVGGPDYFQTLCFEDVGGLAVSVAVNQPFSGLPLDVATSSGGVIDIFLHHLHLLGPDPARWTTHPISG